MDEAEERRFPCVSMLRNNIITISWLSLVSPAVVYSTHISHLSNPSTLLNLSATKSVLIKKMFSILGLPLSHQQSSTLRLFNNTTTLSWLHAYSTYSVNSSKSISRSNKRENSFHFVFTFHIHVTCMLFIRMSEWKRAFPRKSSILICFHMHTSKSFKFTFQTSRILISFTFFSL